MIGSFDAYMIFASFDLTLKCLGILSGSHCTPLVSLWGTFGVSLGHPGRPLGHLGLHWSLLAAPWNCFGDALGLFCTSLRKKCPPGHPSQADGSQVPRLRTKTDPLVHASRFRRFRRSRGNSPRTGVEDLLSTRAGDQDDVSFTNSFK